jgi:hypothetical protein
VVVRLAVHQVPLLDEHGQSLDVVAWLKEAATGTQSRSVLFEHDGQRFSGRLIGCALPAEAAERARAKARKKASNEPRELKEETLFLAGWLLVFSSCRRTPGPMSRCSRSLEPGGRSNWSSNAMRASAQVSPTARQDSTGQ